MPYTFIDIEARKTTAIKALFTFLVAFYFVIMAALWISTRAFFHYYDENDKINVSSAAPFHISLAEMIAVFVISLFIAVLHWRISTHDIVRKVLGFLDARKPDPKDSYHQVFANVVSEVSVATGGRKIEPYIVSTSGLNAFAISDFSGNAAIGITEGLLAKLQRGQLESVVGHEAAHIVNNDSLISSVACSLFAVLSVLLQGTRVAVRKSRGSSAVYLALIYGILSVSCFINLLINMLISRQKEYRADSCAVRLTRNPVALAESLYIISRGWRGVGVIPESFSPIFISKPDYSRLEESESFFADLLSTHPPIQSRLDTLLTMGHSSVLTLRKLDSSKKIKVMPDQAAVEIKNSPMNDGHIAQKGACPHCKLPLSEVLYEGALIYKCKTCGGTLLKNGITSRIMIRDDIAIPEESKKLADIAMEDYSKNARKDQVIKVVYELSCPMCAKKMRRSFYSYAYPLQVDKCDACGNAWFDKGEIEMLQYLFEKRRDNKLNKNMV